MGKSEGNAIYLIDDEKTISKKVMRAVTDAGPTEPNSEKPEPIQNLFTLMGDRLHPPRSTSTSMGSTTTVLSATAI